jgi:pilus assembly protein Flp/PilA
LDQAIGGGQHHPSQKGTQSGQSKSIKIRKTVRTMSSLLHVFTRVQNRVQMRDERGATGVEYGMLVALIAAVMAVTVKALGTKINTAFTTVSNAF